MCCSSPSLSLSFYFPLFLSRPLSSYAPSAGFRAVYLEIEPADDHGCQCSSSSWTMANNLLLFPSRPPSLSLSLYPFLSPLSPSLSLSTSDSLALFLSHSLTPSEAVPGRDKYRAVGHASDPIEMACLVTYCMQESKCERMNEKADANDSKTAATTTISPALSLSLSLSLSPALSVFRYFFLSLYMSFFLSFFLSLSLVRAFRTSRPPSLSLSLFLSLELYLALLSR